MNGANQRTNITFKDSIFEFNQIKTSAFSGNVIIQVIGTPGWMLSFSAGRLSGLSGGIDAVDRWQRSLALASMNAPLEMLVKSNNNDEIFLNSNRLAQEWAVKEVLFDIIQFSQINGDRLSFQTIPFQTNNITLNSSLPLLDIQPLLHTTIQAWQEWRLKGLEQFTPSLFPILQRPMQSLFNGDKELEYLISSIDGNRSLRSLAIHHQKKLIDVTLSLLPFLRSGAIKLARLPKSVIGIDSLDSETVASSKQPAPSESGPLIVCIDDSILVHQSLEKIASENGFRFLGIQDPLKIIPLLIKHKPDLIFLDLIMPVNNGYEVCEQIRKTPCLRDIPTIILTGNDGFIDRVRTKFVGADAFLSKPVRAEPILKTIEKYLGNSWPKSLPGAASSVPDRAVSSKISTDRTTLVGGASAVRTRISSISKTPLVPQNVEIAKRVLVIDDDENIREVVLMCLHKLRGWDVSAVSSGQEGLNSIRAYKPDAIILDMMMPTMDGLTFLRSLRADPATQLIPVVLLTANRHLPGKNLLAELGVANIISKPFVPVNLVQQIDSVVNAVPC